MERRVLLAIFLSFVVLYVYQTLVVKPPPKPVSGGGTSTSSASSTTGGPPVPGVPFDGVSPVTRVPGPPATPTAAALVGDPAERDIRVETRDVIAVFTNRGARLKSWRLKHYLDRQKQPQELIESQLGAQPLPFTLRTTNDQVNATINTALYSVRGAPTAPSESAATELRFEYRDSAGVHAVKTFQVEPSSYVITFAAAVTTGDRPLPSTVVWGPAIGDAAETSQYVQKAEGLLFEADKPERVAPKDIAKRATYDGDFRYAGVDDNYFMTAVLFPGASKISFQVVSVPPPADSKDSGRELVAYAVEPQRTDVPLKFFVGPKDFDVLAAIDRDLTRAIDFGIFAVLVVPLLRSLKWVHGYVGNYGWAIIILTVIINALMFPLRHKSVVSMRKMQEIQPEVKAIQARYAKVKATDPAKQKMNQEMMALYRERGVNPAGGCVPMLLTFPILFAMWALLSTAIELRGAPFVGWIHDLTAHDPYYITPLLMGASQVWQMRLTPTAGVDPMQQKMMTLMPIVFTVMFLWLPAGLAIYYAVTNLWGIGQQYLTNYLIGPPTIRTVRPAAERLVKRGGGSKTEAAPREP